VVHRAEIVYAQGQLKITADNSSLNQILRDLARQTGMKITGGVKDDRVFGTYGPAPAGEVLAELLEGSGTNMLLRETPAKEPAELILTTREGGPTPPNPNAPGFDDDAPARDEGPRGMQPGQPTGAPGMPAMIPPIAPAVPAGGVNGSAPPTPGGANPASPNGVQTPQQIYQQLQQLQQQQPRQ
jgi:hypothetical protein